MIAEVMAMLDGARNSLILSATLVSKINGGNKTESIIQYENWAYALISRVMEVLDRVEEIDEP
jgi:hypothetical protein